MLKKIKNYKIILLKNNNLEMKEYNASALFFLTSSLLLIFVAVLFISLYSTDLSKILSLYEIRKHKQNNLLLEKKIIEQENKIDLLINEISLIKQRDENLRELVKLPKIDDDTRKLGTGGIKKVKDINDLNYLLPNEKDLKQIEDNLNFIKRSINLEAISYNQIESSLENRLNYFLHLPAIHPVSLDQSNLSSRYGYRRDPFSKRKKFHQGDDFSADIGTDVIATANGKVKTSRRYGSFGNYIEIDHNNGYVTVYGHLNKRFVKVGDIVERGQIIGEVGNTGRSTAPHLHYEVQYNNKHVNPKNNYFELKF
tara:strand:+ start:52 stop:984 length:933 start_codon:yes stop_codon:yes gene_type:complete